MRSGGSNKTKRASTTVLSALCLLFTVPANAQPSSRDGIELVVPTAAEGSTDLLAHIVADGLLRRGFGEIRVRNMPGRSGTLAAAYVAAAAPDGATLLIATPSSHGIASALEPGIRYSPVASFTPILRFAAAPYLLVVKPGGPATLADFTEQARRAGGSWRYASTGIGSPHHLVAEYFFQQAGLSLRHIPASGGAAALAQLRGGVVEVMLPAAILALPQVQSGQLQALAITGSRHIQALPGVPTFSEAGFPVDVESWYGLMGPAGLTQDMRSRLAQAVLAIMAEPKVKLTLEALATHASNETGQDFADVIEREVKRWQDLVNKLGIKPGQNDS